MFVTYVIRTQFVHYLYVYVHVDTYMYNDLKYYAGNVHEICSEVLFG